MTRSDLFFKKITEFCLENRDGARVRAGNQLEQLSSASLDVVGTRVIVEMVVRSDWIQVMF